MTGPIQSVSRETLTNRGRGPRWTPEHDALLRRLRVDEGPTAEAIGLRLGRSKSSVQQRLFVLRIVVQPQRPRRSIDPAPIDPAEPRPGDAANSGDSPA